MADSKKHHFVPQFILKNFTEQKNDLVHVFDKHTGRSFASSVLNAGHENHFNSVGIGGEKLNFEDLFGGFENSAAPIISKLVSSDKYFDLSIEEAYTLSLYVCVQQLRTKLMRTTIQTFSNDIFNWIKESGDDINPAYRPIDDNQSKLIALGGFNDLEDRIALLLSKGLILFRAPADNPLWVSDNPVVLHNEYPYGRMGIGTPGTNIHMPISRNFLLGYLCKIECEKIRKTYNLKFNRKEFIEPVIVDFFNALQHNFILDLKPENVDFYNSLQVSYSSRFLYSSTSNFTIAKDMISEDPRVKQTLTTVGIGNERKYPGMPLGEYVVFHLPDDHFMMAIQLDFSAAGTDLVFRATSNTKFLHNLHMLKVVVSSIEVYKDQIMLRLMHEIQIYSIDVVDNTIVVSIRQVNHKPNDASEV